MKIKFLASYKTFGGEGAEKHLKVNSNNKEMFQKDCCSQVWIVS